MAPSPPTGASPPRCLRRFPQLKVVSKTGTGVDNIDVAAATADGCAVCNVPGYGTEVVSDHAIAFALACLRRINEIDADMRAGIWDFHRRRPLGQVHGRTFGVVGYGNIGRAVARKARGLGFNVVVWDHKGVPRRFTPEDFPLRDPRGAAEDRRRGQLPRRSCRQPIIC